MKWQNNWRQNSTKWGLWKPLLAVSLLPCILLPGFVGYRWLTSKDEATPYLISLIDRVEMLEPDTVIIFAEDEADFPFVYSRRMQAYDLDRDYVQIRPINKNDYSEKFFVDTFVKPKRFTTNSGYLGKNLLMVREDAWKKIPNTIQNAYKLMDSDEEFLYFITDDCPFFKE